VSNETCFRRPPRLISGRLSMTQEIVSFQAGGAENEQGHVRLIESSGEKCGSTHLIIDLYGATNLDDLSHVDRTLRSCVQTAGATLLHIHLHHFEPNNGISGVALLAESHISVHTWPEHSYGAFDVFMCGDAKAEACLPVLRAAFLPGKISMTSVLRGPENLK
jgi:S-adenosylmethionine decarboxylase